MKHLLVIAVFVTVNLLPPVEVLSASQPRSQDSLKLRGEEQLADLQPNPFPGASGPLAPAGCSSASPARPLEIPDDGSWVQVCYSDPHAPPKGTVTQVHAKYELDHPDPSQLEVRLTRSDTSIVQPLWSRGAPVQGTEPGRARDLQAFKGLTAPGEWRLQIRDRVPGKKGEVKVVTIRVDYAPVGPLPIQKAGSPAKLGSLYMPIGAGNSKTTDRNPNKPTNRAPMPRKEETQSHLSPQSQVSATATSRQTIENENFEGVFPSCGGAFASACWEVTGDITDTLGHSRQYLWDDNDWKPHNGSWAAWPAAGGRDAIDPEYATYAPDMYSWMAYGPFDLRAGTNAEVNFWLWREIEDSFDKVGFFISTDGANWTPVWWDTSNPNWEQEVFDLTAYVGSETVWVGWLFWSDSTVQFQGPWIDDVNVVILPGEVTARGDFHFFDRRNNLLPAQGLNVYLYDRNGDGTLRELQRGATQANGSFDFAPEMNWRTNTVDADRRLHLVVAWDTDTSNSPVPRRATLHPNGYAYRWVSGTTGSVVNGTGAADFYGTGVADGAPEEPSIWVFDDLRRGSEYVKSRTNPSVDPGGSVAYWELGVTGFGPCLTSSCFFAGVGGPWIFIHSTQPGSDDYPEHELGHNYMWTATGGANGGWWNAGLDCALNHNVWKSVNAGCAWSEGWANFFALAANNDVSFGGENLETPTWGDGHPEGETVEGRVAGALWDLYDGVNDGKDTVTWGLAPIWSQMARNPGYDNFRAYWNGWKASGKETHLSIQAIYQNTIDYDTLPAWSPVRSIILRNFSRTLDMYPYVSDAESSDDKLAFTSVISSDARCGVGLATHFLTARPQAGWTGSCNVTVTASDGIKSSGGIFPVTVTPWGLFFPLIYGQ